MSDIVLDGDTVFVDGHWTHLRTWDLMLDAADRRTSEDGSRRALVHDRDDGLTINYDSDYPGGVTIRGDVRADAFVGHQMVLKVEDVVVDSAKRRSTSAGERRALVHDTRDGLTINWNADYPGGVTINGVVEVPGRLTIRGQDVGDVLAAFETRIARLEEEVRILLLIAGSG